MGGLRQYVGTGTEGVEAAAAIDQVATVHLLSAPGGIIDPGKADGAMHPGVTDASGQDELVMSDRFQYRARVFNA